MIMESAVNRCIKILLATCLFSCVDGQWMSASSYSYSKGDNSPDRHNPQGSPQQGYMENKGSFNPRGQSNQKPKERILVDYPFTVEYVDRRRNQDAHGVGSTKGFAAKAEENLVDYPFTIEYVNRNPARENERNPEQVKYQDSFQPMTQQHAYQPSNLQPPAPSGGMGSSFDGGRFSSNW